ncbi:LacI family DNA-binding transcriptional regulator [Asanoa sp. WMMD1127]|uniref:LacI family DNA-binding transcriptional regulator n=1 Tax=Asanoa sp. WMMD1127 TaxID=3016107 RepID=UPI002416132F|nr:LacI family DNA-binding transcriptional regulator [Asanoa sp. WMMD1127]MDG4825489.1 LacI family DNA-binding transcriptional regulator [Asanoa sp. WMMD1127]
MKAPRPRLRDVAQAAQTSTKTASRVINGDERVSASTRARVEQAVVDLGYRPDPLARSLRRGQDETIGVVVDEVGDPFFASVIGEIERMALDRGISVIIASTRRRAERERIVLDGLLQRRVAGLIIASISDTHAYLHTSPCPLVFIDRPAEDLAADAVVVDDHGGARMAVEHLMRHGHRRIAYIGDRLHTATARHRLAGYRAALEAAGIAPDDALVAEVEPAKGDAGVAAETLLRLPDPPTAVFSANTRCSLGSLPTIHRLRRTDIGFISFGDFAMADTLTPAITIVDHSPEAIGRLAAQRLFSRLAGEAPPVETILAPLRIVARGSGELASRDTP